MVILGAFCVGGTAESLVSALEHEVQEERSLEDVEMLINNQDDYEEVADDNEDSSHEDVYGEEVDTEEADEDYEDVAEGEGEDEQSLLQKPLQPSAAECYSVSCAPDEVPLCRPRTGSPCPQCLCLSRSVVPPKGGKKCQQQNECKKGERLTRYRKRVGKRGGVCESKYKRCGYALCISYACCKPIGARIPCRKDGERGMLFRINGCLSWKCVPRPKPINRKCQEPPKCEAGETLKFYHKRIAPANNRCSPKRKHCGYSVCRSYSCCQRLKPKRCADGLRMHILQKGACIHLVCYPSRKLLKKVGVPE